jgi:hypothetical protein
MKLTKQSFRKQLLAVVMVLPLTVGLMGCSVDTVLSDIDIALQTAQNLETAIGAVSPADAAVLSLLTGLATTGVTAIQAAYNSYESSKTASNLANVVALAKALQANLPQELAAAHITDPNAVAKATAWANLITDTVGAIVNQIQPPAMATPTSQAKAMPTPELLQARWQSEVCRGDVACGALVKVHHKHAKLKL